MVFQKRDKATQDGGQTWEDEDHRPTFRVSVDTMALYDRLKKAAVGEVVSYAEMNKIIGANVQLAGRGKMESARKMLERERVAFGVIFNEGLKRLNDLECVGTGTQTMTRIKHMATRGARKLACVREFDAMPEAERIRHNALVSTIGAINLFAKEKSIKVIEGSVEKQQAKLPIQRTLELFK